MKKLVLAFILGFLLNFFLEPRTDLNQCYVGKDGIKFYHRITMIRWDGYEAILRGDNLGYHSWDDGLFRVILGVQKCQ